MMTHRKQDRPRRDQDEPVAVVPSPPSESEITASEYVLLTGRRDAAGFARFYRLRGNPRLPYGEWARLLADYYGR